MTILARDNGSGTNAGAWGTGSDGNFTWNHAAGSSSLSRGGGELSANGGTQTNLMLYGPSATDQDSQVNIEQNDSGNFMGAVIRCTGNTFYYCDIGVFSNFFVVGKCISGSFNDLQFFSFTPSANTKYTVKLQAIGTTINAAIWVAGGSQPAYQISFTDTSIASGNAGCYFFGGGSSAGTFDNYVMTDGSTTTTSTRTIPASAAVLTTEIRTMPAHASVLTTSTREIPAHAATLVTNERIIPAHASVLASKIRTIPDVSSVLVVSKRTIPAVASVVNSRKIPCVASVSVEFQANTTLIVPGGSATLIIPSGQTTLIL